MGDKAIRFFVTDIDGTLTDGKVYMGPDGEALKAFSIKDGYAFSFLLRESGIQTVVITGRNSLIVKNRCEELGIAHVSQGVVDKLPEMVRIVGEESLGSCAYFGDDVLDLPCMLAIKSKGGVVGCPADAVESVKAASDYVCINKAGDGAAREFVEWLLADRPSEENVRDRVSQGISAVKQLIAEGAADGEYRINEWLTIVLKEIATVRPEEMDFESHRKCIDIQWVVAGEEAIDVAPADSLIPKTDYDSMKDVVLWHPVSNPMRVVLNSGGYVILYPRDAHRPCIALGPSGGKARVAVAKVSLL